ncbi:MAG: hypothetical protein M1165_01850 [Candidatus Pacearchaeota archaeon]|nr:hypothetical protein [Candidatus Pacearchaeota archaeon]
MTKFGMEEKKEIYERYIGKWITIYPVGMHSNFSGKLVEIIDGYGILKEIIDAAQKEGKLVRMLIKGDGESLVPLFGSAVEPTTEGDITGHCEISNKRDEEKSSK